MHTGRGVPASSPPRCCCRRRSAPHLPLPGGSPTPLIAGAPAGQAPVGNSWPLCAFRRSCSHMSENCRQQRRGEAAREHRNLRASPAPGLARRGQLRCSDLAQLHRQRRQQQQAATPTSRPALFPSSSSTRKPSMLATGSASTCEARSRRRGARRALSSSHRRCTAGGDAAVVHGGERPNAGSLPVLRQRTHLYRLSVVLQAAASLLHRHAVIHLCGKDGLPAAADADGCTAGRSRPGWPTVGKPGGAHRAQQHAAETQRGSAAVWPAGLLKLGCALGRSPCAAPASLPDR